MKLSAHFTLEELTNSSVAHARGLDNSPPSFILPRLVQLAELLERIRSTLNVPVSVTSGYRSDLVNKAVGGAANSDHTRGHAADIVAPAFGDPEAVARALAPLVDTLGIGQLILEGLKGKRWVHVSTRVPDKAVNRVLTITDAGTVAGVQSLA